MDALLVFFREHETISLLVLYWGFSVLASLLHRPTESSSALYKLLFSMVQWIAGALGRATDKRPFGILARRK